MVWLWCSIAHGIRFVYFRLVGCVCFAVNFYFYVYHLYDNVFVVCIMCEHVCKYFCSWNIELFIHFGLSRYVYKATFSTHNLVFYYRYCLLLSYIHANSVSFKNIDFRLRSVDDTSAPFKKKTTIKTIRFLCTLLTNAWHLSITVKILLTLWYF